MMGPRMLEHTDSEGLPSCTNGIPGPIPGYLLHACGGQLICVCGVDLAPVTFQAAQDSTQDSGSRESPIKAPGPYTASMLELASRANQAREDQP